MSSDERRNKIIVGVVIIVVTVAIVALILLKTSTSAALTCQLTDTEPTYASEPEQLKPVASQDNKTLVAFQGYLIYHGLAKDEKKINLPLELSSVEVASAQTEASNQDQDQEPELQRLVLNLDCAKINITLKTEKASGDKLQSSKVSASEISVHLETSANNKLDSCQVDKPDLITYTSDKHFECSDFDLVCTTKKPKETPADVDDGDEKSGDKDDESITLVTLKMKKLQFELNGDVEKHKKGEFSSDAMQCAKH